MKILRRVQPIVHFDAADHCRLFVTTMKAMNFQDDIPSFPLDNFKNHYVQVFHLTSMQEAAELCNYSELIGEPLSLELIFFALSLEHVTELIVLGERMSLVGVDMFGVVGKTSKMDIVSPQQTIKCFPLLKYRFRGSILFAFFSILDNDTFALINTQTSNLEGQLWITIANSCQLFFLQTFLDVKSTVSSSSITNR